MSLWVECSHDTFQVLYSILKNHLSSKEIYKEQQAEKNHHRWLYRQIIYSVSMNHGNSAEIIAPVLGIAKSKVYRTVENYNTYGPEWIKQRKWGGRREESCHLSMGEEKELLEEIKNRAIKGYVLTASDIRQEVESKLGHKVSYDYIWDLFKRHDWKKKSPRPKHPKSDAQKQDELKKYSKKIWQPLS